jgi:hypothetical protein
MDRLGDIWARAGLTLIESRTITVNRNYASFEDFWTVWTANPGLRTVIDKDDRGRRRAVQIGSSLTTSGRCYRRYCLPGHGQRHQRPRPGLIRLQGHSPRASLATPEHPRPRGAHLLGPAKAPQPARKLKTPKAGPPRTDERAAPAG